MNLDLLFDESAPRSPVSAQAAKHVEKLAKLHAGDWAKVRKDLRQDFDLLFSQGTTGGRLYAYALDDAYHELNPSEI